MYIKSINQSVQQALPYTIKTGTDESIVTYHRDTNAETMCSNHTSTGT